MNRILFAAISAPALLGFAAPSLAAPTIFVSNEKAGSRSHGHVGSLLGNLHPDSEGETAPSESFCVSLWRLQLRMRMD